jgi:thiamine-monophosphate kinase
VARRIQNETELIQTYLAPLTRAAPGAFGLNDDAALIAPEPGTDLVLSTDPVVAGVHFFETDRADDIAWKAIAVNVSDLVAKGAEPLAYTLALAFPAAPEAAWMAEFARGLASAQAAFGCHLIGGDTDRTSGPLSIGVTAIGVLPRGSFVPRHGAKAGDHVFVTGTLGDSALGLALHRDPSLYGSALTDGDRSFLLGRYLRPSPRLAMTSVLRAYASAALDVSDGLAKDLARLAGGRGIRVSLAALPLSPPARAALAANPRVIGAAISGGDDYEVLFAVAPDQLADFEKAVALAAVATTRLGVLNGPPGVVFIDSEGQQVEIAATGYDHFGTA